MGDSVTLTEDDKSPLSTDSFPTPVWVICQEQMIQQEHAWQVW